MSKTEFEFFFLVEIDLTFLFFLSLSCGYNIYAFSGFRMQSWKKDCFFSC